MGSRGAKSPAAGRGAGHHDDAAPLARREGGDEYGRSRVASTLLYLASWTLGGGRRRPPRVAGRADAVTDRRRTSGRAGMDVLRKEVIQPQVPLRLPCYDLVPITGFIFGA